MTLEVTIAPKCRHVVTVKLDSLEKIVNPSSVCIEPATVPIHGIFAAPALSKVGAASQDTNLLTLQPAQARTVTPANSFQIMPTNLSREELTLPKATVLGVAEEISETLVDVINKGDTSNMKPSTRPRRENKNQELYQKLLAGKMDQMAPSEKRLIEPVLRKYAHMFHDEDTNDFKSTNVIEHTIVVTDPTPIRRPQYRTQFALCHEIEWQVRHFAKRGNSKEPLSLFSPCNTRLQKKFGRKTAV
jgi:hypothetical protein